MAQTTGEPTFSSAGVDSRIKVAVRIRPLLDNELQQGHQCSLLKANEQTHTITITKGNESTSESSWHKTYNFDQVYSKTKS